LEYQNKKVLNRVYIRRTTHTTNLKSTRNINKTKTKSYLYSYCEKKRRQKDRKEEKSKENPRMKYLTTGDQGEIADFNI
jgi:hypothetical protein